ncbi:MAG: cytidylate kinase-like family protein [Ignavibacteria bacterium]|nr:cytidylate kinase-like family protein [Ignavibacteria bacterium]
MEYNRFVDLSKSYLYCQLQRSEGTRYRNTHQHTKLPFLTISREAGCGETEITASILDELTRIQEPEECPWTLYDKELAKKVVEDYNISGIQSLLPEKKFSEIQTMFEELFGLHPTKREMAHNISKSILRLADMGNAIVVGRGAFYITRHFSNALHVRLIGSLPKRVKHMVNEYSMSLRRAEDYIIKEDHERKEYVKKLFGVDLNDPHHYDMVINTDKLNVREITELVCMEVLALKQKLVLNEHLEELSPI